MAQLEDALDAFVREHHFDHVTVIVDATFGHRINPKERKWYEEAITAGRMITPPAGAVGRGDAFVLEVARRADGVVLSNDSFQEFHGTHPWLFEEGRLYGGKPIPHVGWVFVQRTPVRGATSRRAVRSARVVGEDAVATAKTDAPAPAVTPKTKDTAVSRRPSKVDAAKRDTKATSPSPAPTVTQKAAPKAESSKAESHTKLFNSPEAFARFAAEHPVGSPVEITIERFSSHGAYGSSGDVVCYIPTKLLSDPPPAKARDVLSVGSVATLFVYALHNQTHGIDLAGYTTSPRDMDYADARRSTLASSEPESRVDETPGTGIEQPTRRGELVAARKKAAKKAAKKAPAKKSAKKAAKKATKKSAKKATKKASKSAGGRKKATKAGGRKKAAKRAKKA